ncbi:hypothetical protein AUC47_11575 [Microbacterium sp. SZ1]|nr:hypothetical protein AUC47_11575 [Microbacterium sp. SZ1]
MAEDPQRVVGGGVEDAGDVDGVEGGFQGAEFRGDGVAAEGAEPENHAFDEDVAVGEAQRCGDVES